jgi:putative membrane protein
MRLALTARVASVAVMTCVAVACGGDDTGNNNVGGAAGSAGSVASGGAGGSAGSVGSGGSGGSDASTEGGVGGSGGIDASAEAGRDSGADVDAGANAAPVASDVQVVTVLHVANVGEIQEAQRALVAAQNSDVRDFATMMITDHTAGDASLLALFPPLGGSDASADGGLLDAGRTPDGGIPLAESITSLQLRAQAAATLTALQPLSGAVFDLAYMEGQVAAHSQLLTIGDEVLTPAAHTDAVRAALMQARATVVLHLQHAMAIRDSLLEAGAGD